MKQLLLFITLISVSSFSYADDVVMECFVEDGFLLKEQDNNWVTLRYKDGYFRDEAHYRFYGKWLNVCETSDISCQVEDFSALKLMTRKGNNNKNDKIIIFDFFKKKQFYSFSSSDEPLERDCYVR